MGQIAPLCNIDRASLLLKQFSEHGVEYAAEIDRLAGNEFAQRD